MVDHYHIDQALLLLQLGPELLLDGAEKRWPGVVVRRTAVERQMEMVTLGSSELPAIPAVGEEA